MRLEEVRQHFVTVTLSKEDCALLAHMLTVAADYEATGVGQTLAQAWLTAATTIFEAAALVAGGGAIILDAVPVIGPEDRAGFTVDAIRDLAEALIAPRR